MPDMINILALLTGYLLLLCCLWSSYLMAGELTGGASVSERWAATALVSSWHLVISFYLLSLASAFHPMVTLVLWLAIAAGCQFCWSKKQNAAAQLASDLSHLFGLFRQCLSSPLRWILVAMMILIALRVFRGLVAPPLAWDALTYHLTKAGTWVQSGGWATMNAPDAWGYYEYFQPIGDILWAWALLPVSGDALLAPAGLLLWSALILGAYATARSLNAGRAGALLAALAIGTTPAVFNFLTASYVNNTTLAFLLLGLTFLRRALFESQPRWALLSGAGFGLSAGTQHSGLPFLLLFMAFLIGALLVKRVPWFNSLRTFGAALFSSGVALPGYLRAWIEHGSPIFPLTLKVGGWTLHPGHEEFVLLTSGKLTELKSIPFSEFMTILFFKVQFPGHEHANLGPAGCALVLLGLASALVLLRRRGYRTMTSFLLLMLLLIVLGLFSDSMFMQRSHWAYVVGRFLTPALAVLVIMIPLWGARYLLHLLLMLILINLFFDIPRGWSLADLKAMSQLAIPLLIGVFLGAELLLQLGRRGRPIVAVGAAILALTVCISCRLFEVRAQYRYLIYAAASRLAGEGSWDNALDVHALFPFSAASWPIWKHLDTGRPHRLAVTAGWDGIGHNWYRYPLMGSKLQNKLFYIAPTRDGAIVDYRHAARLAAQADCKAWVQRLMEQRIDHVAVLYPHPFEDRWMIDHHQVFIPVAVGQGGQGHLYRLHLPNAQTWLSTAE